MTGQSKKATSRTQQTRRYAAKLLFQFRVVTDGQSDKRRTCIESIINFHAQGASAALRHAKKRGREREVRYANPDGNPVFVEFVGVLDLQDLGSECEEDEVWYNVKTVLTPMERKSRILPAEKDLCVFK